jgi:hypothetical protein
MDSNLLQERMDAKKAMEDAEKAMEEAQAEYKEAKEAFAEGWKKKNPNGSKDDMLDYLEIKLKRYSAAVENKEEIYKKLVETYQKTMERGQPFEPDDPLPAPNTAKTPLFSSAQSFFESPTLIWRVSGTIRNALSTKGVRCRMYRNADSFIGYYEEGKPALYYEAGESTLQINVLFKSEDNAMRFQSQVLLESSTFHSPMNSLEITADVTSSYQFQLRGRIFFKDYIPTDSESPQDTQSQITEQFSLFDATSDEFKYQRIEKFSIFGTFGKAESCHLISSSHCRNYFQTYGSYDKDSNNRLAMSRDLHGWFDYLTTEIPLFYLKIVSISDTAIVEGRFKVVIAVVAWNQEAANMIFWRLIEGSTKTNDPLVMHTFVYVTNPAVFQRCLEWKEKENTKLWNEYVRMDSAVP